MPERTRGNWPPRAGNSFTPWIPAGVWSGVLFALSAQSDLPNPSRFGITDKTAHFLAFGVLGVALAYGRYRSRLRPAHWAVLAAGVVYGVLDELHQSFVPARHPTAGDVVADALGVATGYGAVVAVIAVVGVLLALRSSGTGPR